MTQITKTAVIISSGMATMAMPYLIPMDFFRRIFRWLSGRLSELGSFLLTLHADVSKKLYEKVVDRSAMVMLILMLAALLWFSGGGEAVDRVRSLYSGEQLALRDRKLTGELRDSQTGKPIPGAEVAAVDANQKPVLTDENGRFVLNFQAHKDTLRFEISFSKEGYEERTILRDIPLNKKAEEKVQSFYLVPG